MAGDDDRSEQQDRHIHGYNRMMERVRTALQEVEQGAYPSLHDALERAKRRAVELGELTREDAERIGDWLRRDLEQAADYLADTGRELRDWLRFDLQFLETWFLDQLWNVADRTRLELLTLQQRFQRAVTYRTGEVTGPGTLACTQCDHTLRFHATGHIPPCPHCHGTAFQRSTGPDE